MSDCTNLEMRDLLPDLARGALTGPSRMALDAHLATCADCRAELEVVRKAHAALSATPSVDASRIAATVARSTALRREATASVAQARRRRSWGTATPARRAWLAAASVAAIAAGVLLASNLERDASSPDIAPVVARVDEPEAPTPATPEPIRAATPRPASEVELVMGGGVSDLADADLESLLRALDDVDTNLDVEPAVLLPVLEGDV
ncbi:MAG TPA: zf-HC2 domain-containing protein [Gemmatimonadaceae bacterium]|nr:zf-HC2 domain-containing protein [Gemmatimonadaceae bacterium]